MNIAEKLQSLAENEQAISNGINTEADLIEEIKNIVNNLPEAGGNDDEFNVVIAEQAEIIEEIQDLVGALPSRADAFEEGKKEAIENLPSGYIKTSPLWMAFSYLCYCRPDIIKHLKYEDTANGTDFLATFSTLCPPYVKEDIIIPRLDYRKGKTFTNMFIYSSSIVEVGEMDISNATAIGNAFLGCTGLQKISFAKGCIKISVSLASCSKLDNDSIQSIIDGLATVETAQTLTLHSVVGAKLTDAQKATITAKNWTLVY